MPEINLVYFSVYSIYDEDLDSFGFPFTADNDSAALRRCVSDFILFDDVVLSDVKVFEIGQFDSKTGEIHAYTKDCFHLAFTGTDILAKIKSYRKKIQEAEELAQKDIQELQKLKCSKEAK